MSALQAVTRGRNFPAHHLLGPVEARRSGILLLGLDMFATIVASYAHQLSHTNPSTQASAPWGLLWTLWPLNTCRVSKHGRPIVTIM